MGLFSTQDAGEQKRKKFAEFESMSAGDENMASFTKAQWLTSRGNALGAKGDYEGAIRDFDEAVALVPDYLPAHLGAAIAFNKIGREEEALQIIKEAPKKMRVGDQIFTKEEVMREMMGDVIVE